VVLDVKVTHVNATIVVHANVIVNRVHVSVSFT
jgi:hypothetical protein